MGGETIHYDERTIGNLNRRYAVELGWRSKYHQVKFLLGIKNTLPEPMVFAHAVSDWQAGNPPLKTDGLLGPRTWAKMRPLTRMNAPSMSPLPGWLRMNTVRRVKYNVPLVVQSHLPECWLACAAMMFSYKNRKPVAIADLPRIGQLSASLLFTEQMSALGRMGFLQVPYSSQWFGEEDLLSSLSRFGPLMAYLDAARIFDHPEPESGHAIIITGVNTATDTCYINNPWGQKDERKDVDLVLYALDKWKEKVGRQGVALMSLA